MNEIEKDKQLLMMTNQNLENQISDLNTKINQINLENESQLKLYNDSKKKTIKDYNDQIDELKNKYEALQTKFIETESKLKTQEQLVEFAKLDQEDIKIKLENELRELTNKFEALQKKSENEKKKSTTQLELKENIIQKLFNQQKEIENESENKLKEKEEKINMKAKEFEK